MNKVFAGFVVALMAAFMSFGFMTSAHADYGDNGTPPTSETPPTVKSTSPQASTPNVAGVLPSTGGPNEYALVGAVALIAVGGASIAVSRRRRTS